MNKRVWMHMVTAVLVAGLFLTVSCAKKTVVSDATTIESQDQAQGQTQEELNAQAQAEAERIAQERLEEERLQEEAIEAAKVKAARDQFENDDIHFEYDSAQLSAMAKMKLKEKAAWLKMNSMASVTIEGHCDERGTTEYNLALGERRASTAKAYLVNLGVSTARLNTISYGEEQPLDSGKTESAFSKNRRAHFALD